MKTPKNPPKKPPHYLSRSVQLRLLLMVGSCMFVLLIASEAAKPHRWQWMFRQHPGTDSTVDNRLPITPPANQPPDAVTIRRLAKSAPHSSEGQGEGAGPRSQLEGISRDRFQVITDDSTFRSQESELWYDILARLRDRPETSPSAATRVSFTQLYRQPDSYRGRFVSVSGIVRRAHRVTAARNTAQIDSYWQCWLFPTGAANPIVVDSLSMPEGFPQGMQIHQQVTFTGIFFKRWAYPSLDGMRSTPLILAASGDWHQSAEITRVDSGSPTSPWSWSILIILAAAMSALFIGWVRHRSMQFGNSADDALSSSTSPPSFQFLEQNQP